MSALSGVIVLDASAAASLVLPSQETLASNDLMGSSRAVRFVAPYIFLWETCNLVVRYARAHKTSAAPLVKALDLLDVDVWPSPDRPRISELIEMSLNEHLSLFDAGYLALAAELDAPLATRDAGLLRAAALAGAAYLDLR